MNELLILYGDRPARIIKTAMENRLPLRMSYTQNGKWKLRRIFVDELRSDNFDAVVTPYRKNEDLNLQAGTSVGLSLHSKNGKGYDNFIFGTNVIALKWCGDNQTNPHLVLNIPEQIEIVQRRNYIRAKVPKSIQVDVDLSKKNTYQPGRDSDKYKAKLIDISAGGVQIALPEKYSKEFVHGDYLGIKFTPLPNETPLRLNARVKSVLPTADNRNVCIGLETIGLEASAEGRLVLQRLCNTVEQYRLMNRQKVQLTPHHNISQ